MLYEVITIHQVVAELGKFEKEVFLMPVLCRPSADSTYRVLKFSGLKVFSTALVAFISPSCFATVRTGSFHIAVRKEAVTCRTIGDFYNFRVYIVLFYQPVYNIQGTGMVFRVIGCSESVKVNSKLLERFIKVFMIDLYKFFSYNFV